MSDENKYPSLLQQGKNLAEFAWELINYVENNQSKMLFVSDEVYKHRITTCKNCDKYDELENRCKECGCYVPVKAKIILDSCPLEKWGVDNSSWEEKFNSMIEDLSDEQSQ